MLNVPLRRMPSAPLTTPRDTTPSAAPKAWQRLASRVWRELEAFGQRRAAFELRQLAERWRFTRPELAQTLHSAAREASAVRRLADHHQRSDPGFASDLYAAADRHERLHDEDTVAAVRSR